MKIIKNLYGEDTPHYENSMEKKAACDAYLNGDYSNLSALEVQFFQSCFDDPNNIRTEAAHAGMLSEEVDPKSVEELIIVHDLGHTLEEGWQIVRDLIGPHPITPLSLYLLDLRLTAPSTPKTR